MRSCCIRVCGTDAFVCVGASWLSWLRDLVPSGVRGRRGSRRQAADDAAADETTNNVTEKIVPYISGYTLRSNKISLRLVCSLLPFL